MKNNISSINKIIKKFDKELKQILTNELKISKVTSKTRNSLTFSSPNKLRIA